MTLKSEAMKMEENILDEFFGGTFLKIRNDNRLRKPTRLISLKEVRSVPLIMNINNERKKEEEENSQKLSLDEIGNNRKPIETQESHRTSLNDDKESLAAPKSDHTNGDRVESFADISIRRSVSRQQELMQSVVIKNILNQVIATYNDLDELSHAMIHRKTWWTKLTESNKKFIDLFEEMLSEVHSIYQSKLKVSLETSGIYK